MKTATLTLLLMFFSLVTSVFSTELKQNYGLQAYTHIKGAKIDVDDCWINYAGNLYRIMNSPSGNPSAGILFIEGEPDIVAEISPDGEYVRHNRNNYQRFRTDWQPSPSQQFSMQRSTSPLVAGLLVLLVIFVIRGICSPKPPSRHFY